MQIVDLVPDLQPVILAAREVRDARNTLARFLPNTPVQAVSYRLGRRRRADQTVPVRAIDAPAVPIRRPGVVDVRGDLPAITPIVDLSEQDLTNEMVLARQLAGLPVDWTGAVESAAAQAALTVDNTLEQMRAQLLSTGVVSLETADGETHAVDFDIPDELKISVTTPWNSGGDAFVDFDAAHQAYQEAAGQAAGVVLTTSRVKRALLAALAVKYPNAPVDVNTLNAYLTANDLPQIVTYDRVISGYDGTKSRLYPEGTMTFLPADDQPVGRTELGVTQEAVQQVQGGVLTAAQAPGVTIVTLGQDNPVQRAVKAAALGLPVLQDNDAITIVSGIFG